MSPVTRITSLCSVGARAAAVCAGAYGGDIRFGVNVRKCFYKEIVVMNITLGLAPLVSLLAGILILIVPRLLNFIVAVYLIVIGLIGLFGAGNYRF